MADAGGLGQISIDITIGEEYKQGLTKAQKDVNKFAKNISKEFKNVGKKELAQFGKNMQAIGGNISDLGKSVTKFTAPLAVGLGLAVKSASSFEEASANLAKSLDLTVEEAQKYNKKIAKLSTTTRTATKDLYDIAVVGGQLGVASDEIVGFTESVDKLVVSLGDEFAGGVEEITKGVGTIVNQFKLVDREGGQLTTALEKVGSAVNELGAAGQATGPYIADFTKRLGGIAPLIGITVEEVLALGASFEEMGVSSQVSSTAVVSILGEMGKNVSVFADIAGKSTDEFSRLLKDDAFEALLLVADGVGEAGTDLETLSGTLDDLGVDGTRAVGVLGNLANNTELVRDRVDVANKAYAENISLQKEFEKKNTTMQANLSKLKDAFTLLGIEIGAVVIGPLSEFVQKIVGSIVGLAEKFDKLPNSIKKGIVIFSSLLIALGPLLIALGGIISAVGTVSTAIAGIGTVLGVLAPVLIIVGAISALGASFIVLSKKFGFLDTIVNRMKLIFTQIKNTLNNIKLAFEDSRVQGAIDKFKGAFESLVEAFKPLFESLDDAFHKIFDSLDDITGDDGVESTFLSVEEAVKLLASTFEILGSVVEEVTPFIEFFVNILAGIIDKVMEVNSVVAFYRDAVKEAFADPEIKTALEELKDVFIEGKKAVNDLIEAFKSFFQSEKEGAKETKGAEKKQVSLLDTIKTIAKVIKVVIGITKAYSRVLTVIVKVITGVLNIFKILGNYIKELPETIRNAIDNINRKWDEFRKKVSDTWNAFTRIVSDTIETVKTTIITFFIVTLPSKIEEGRNKIVELWETLPEKAYELGYKIGDAINNIITFYKELPDKVNEGLTLFVENTRQKFEEFRQNALDKFSQFKEDARIKFEEFVENAKMKAREFVEGVIEYIRTLPERVSAWLQTTIELATTKWDELKESARQKAQEIINAISGFFKTLPEKVGKEIDNTKTIAGNKFQEIIDKAYQWGKDIVNNIVAGIKSIGSGIGDTVSSFVSGFDIGLSGGKMYGGLIKAMSGGLIKAQSGLLNTMRSGTDNMLALLTEGEMVLPRNVTGNLMNVLKQMSSLKNVSGSETGISGAQALGGLNMNVQNLYTKDEDEARRRGGDLAFGLKSGLMAKGII